MKNIVLACLAAFFLAVPAAAQENRLGNKAISSVDIYERIQKLGFLGSALFIAAHPDDENTRLISWLSNEKKAKTAYLSITRGDGGQNLIGPQLREQLGIIRTQELLEARNIDGGEQFFTRANDFGYSKNPEETLKIWNKKQVLSDIVQIIRTFKPDVIINRFDHRSPGTTHGHHTSSALLSVEAFDLAGSPNAFPDQLNRLDTWQPERLFFNTSWWFYGSQEAFEKADKTNLYTLESGTFLSTTGYSLGEIAALSRSKHQSQGFGSSGSRGTATEYLEFLKGSRPDNPQDIFAGVNTTWARIDSTGKLENIWQALLNDYDFKEPSKSIKQLFALRTALNSLSTSHWQQIKLEEVNTLLMDAGGIYIKATTNQPSATPGEEIPVTIEITNRGLPGVRFSVDKTNLSTDVNEYTSKLKSNESAVLKTQTVVPIKATPTSPFYLNKRGTKGMYVVEQDEHIGKPELDPGLQILVTLFIDNQIIEYTAPILYQTTDRVRGEIYEPLHIVPNASVAIENPVHIFKNGEIKDIAVTIKAYQDVNGILQWQVPAQWSLKEKSGVKISIKQGEQQTMMIPVKAPDHLSAGDMTIELITDDQIFDQEVIAINFPHIPNQQLLFPSKTQLVNPGIINKARKVAYINGAGDDVAAAIEAMGSQVTSYDPSNVPVNLEEFDALVIGIRAFNVAPQEMAALQSLIADYVKNGGVVIMQYNTNRGVSRDALGPLEISLSRKRVTDENAEVSFIQPDHPALNIPNKITSNDFEGWVQERGLYFPDDWDPAFVPLLEMSDPGESPTNGSLIVARYGDGHIVYTGLSFFRELPAGVPGAYKLLANLLSLGQNETDHGTK